MPPEIATALIDLALPLLGILATGLLSLLTWIANRAYRKLDDICAQLHAGHRQFSEHDRRICVLESRCHIFHKEA